MSLVTGAASYKKKSGLLTIYEDRSPSILQWRAADNEIAIPSVEIVLSTISQMKATPATSEVMRLMVIVKPSEGEEAQNYVFTFGNKLVMENIKESLQQIVARYKSALQATQFVNDAKEKEKPLINTTFLDDALDTKRLLKNHELQQKLLLDDKLLMATFTQAVIKEKLDPLEFWSTRVHQLRAFALANSQKRGPYNVLSSIKPTATSDNQVNVSVTREKIHTIFEQYPIVRKAYDDNVPRISEGEFWSRFFSSKLFRKLRGEKVNVNIRGDFILDKYINMDVDYEEQPEVEYNVNKIIDLEANQEDDPSKLGNKPDMTMQQDAIPETVQVLRSMNRLSQKMMNSLEYEYSRSATPDTQSKEQREKDLVKRELTLADLQKRETTEYLKLNVLSSKTTNEEKTPETESQNKQTTLSIPTKPQFIQSLKAMKRTLETTSFNLSSPYQPSKKPHIETTSRHISQLITLNAKQSQQTWSSSASSSAEHTTSIEIQDQISKDTIDQQTLESLRITHSTTVEFLRHFWQHFQSGDEKSIGQLRSLAGSLVKSLERINSAIDNVQGDKKVMVRKWFDGVKKSVEWALKKYGNAMKEQQQVPGTGTSLKNSRVASVTTKVDANSTVSSGTPLVR